MDVFNKLRNAVSSALPGIPLNKDFEIQNQVASGGPGLVWKIFSAIKKTTKQEASVFVFEKKYLEKYPKKDRDVITETLKKGISQLTRLRHPRILSIVHPLEESRETLAFATEPVFASLANVLGNHDNMPSPVPKEIEEFKLFEVEIKHGLLQITEGLGFLHRDAKLMHNNICQESIIINKYGTWKLAGFDCCIPNANKQDQSAPLYPFCEWDPEVPPLIQPHLDYLAPEYALTMACSEASDMFSLGVLVHAIYNNGKPLYECRTQLSLFRKYAEELRKFRSSLLGNVPEGLQQYVKLLLNTEPSVRPDPDQLSKIEFFEDVGTMTLQYMDSLFQKDNLQKSQFFKGLPKIIPILPKRVNLQRILPALIKECVNADMIPFVLPNLLLMAEQSSDKEYTSTILPHLIPLFRVKEPIQVLLIFMQNMNLLLKKTPQSDVRNHILPMIHQALEADNPQLQEMCLKVVPTFADLIEFTALKNSIVPRIKKICLSTSTLSVRTNCLLCLGKLLDYMDKWTVLDDILPLLPLIPTREPAVLMSMLGIYQVTLTSSKLGITKEIMANKVLPFIIPLAIDNNLNLSQFNAYMTTIKDMLSRLESEHRTKLEQIDQMKQEQKSIEISQFTGKTDQPLVKDVETSSDSRMDKFWSQFGVNSSPASSRKAEVQPSPTRGHSEGTSISNAGGDGTSVQPKKVLSLEEKQRLAQQQEQQVRFKSQKPINPNTGKTTPTSTMGGSSTGRPAPSSASGTKGQVKDLTSSLMSTNMMQMNLTTNSSNLNSTASSGNKSNFPNYSNVMTPQQNSFGAGQSGIKNQGFGSVTQGNSSSMNPSNNFSSLDSLLPSSSQPKMTLNQMQKPNMGQSSVMQPQSMMGYNSQGMMGTQGMMGSQSMIGSQGMMGMQSGFGYQPMSGGQGMQSMPSSQFQHSGNQPFPMNSSMGNVPAFQSTGNNFSQTSMTTQGNSNSASNDLKDIFG